MTLTDDELVSVIIPAYNAERFIEATLKTIQAQTYPHFEAIIVDDGSKDRTAEIARDFVTTDKRFRVLTKPNGGVASARNLGLREARGRLFAPCDADDLWAPPKLQHQVTAWREAGPNVGLVYSWYAVIDDTGAVKAFSHQHMERGDVFERMCGGNLVGNGSLPLMRRDVVMAFGGYDETLRARGAQGCEDFKLYLQIASKHSFGLAEQHDVGYRHTDGNMSSDFRQMLRSYDIVLNEFRAAQPQYEPQFQSGRGWLLTWLRQRALAHGGPVAYVDMFVLLVMHDWRFAARTFYWTEVRDAARALKRMLRGDKRNASFKKGRRRAFIGPPGSGALWIQAANPT